jgi:hypothetical protein
MPELNANRDGQEDQQHEHEGAVVLAWRAACVWITKLWQEKNFLSLNRASGAEFAIFHGK